MDFEFATATRIRFGPGVAQEVAPAAVSMGKRALVVTGRPERAAPLLMSLEEQGMSSTSFQVSGEPSTETAMDAVNMARQNECDVVIGLGGGSVLDVGKAAATLLTNGGEPLDYLEVIGRGQPITRPSAPYIAVPTTAGTGAEVTRNAVLYSAEHRVKVSLRSPLMLPHLAVVDPELTYSLPPQVTASTGLDALTQVLEPYVSSQPNPLTDAICREGLRRAARSLRRVFQSGHDAAAREDLALASLFGGLALANAKLGAVHGFAGPLGGMLGAPHGVLCARILPFVMETNVRALMTRAPEHPALRRYDEIARLLTGRPEATASDGADWVSELCTDLEVPTLGEVGLTEDTIPEAVTKSARASSMKGNPIPLLEAELQQILEQAL